MRKIYFENLVEADIDSENYGKPLFIEVPDDFDDSGLEKIAEKARESARTLKTTIN